MRRKPWRLRDFVIRKIYYPYVVVKEPFRLLPEEALAACPGLPHPNNHQLSEARDLPL